MRAGDLLVGWFAEYNAQGTVHVSDNVNGAWTRAPGSTAFQNDTGDIALYYVQNTKPAAGGLTVSVSASASAYLQGSLAEYSGVAVAGPLDQIVSNRGVGTAVDTGPTAGVPAGELVYSALVTGNSPGNVTPGASQGVSYTPRARTTSGSAFEEDIASAVAGPQKGTAGLANTADWYAVVATFRPASSETQAPTVPQNLHATSVAATSVSLTWSPSTDDVAVTGYTVYRNGTPIATPGPNTTSYTDTTVVGGVTYSYTVDAFDGAGNHSAQSPPVQVTTPTSAPAFVQGAADSPGTRTTSATLTLPSPVAAGHLLVGWFAQYDASGQVQVSDNVNGAWTRAPASEHFNNGGGDLALYYVQNTRAAASLTVTMTAAGPTYLPSAVAEYSGVATSNALDQTAVGRGSGTSADSGPTASAPGGELVFGAMITGGQPLTVTPGSSQGVPFTLEVYNGSRSCTIEGILSSASGPQNARFGLATSTDWYAVAATFRAA
ncbi:fibronectin type III domain-containing protein [Streptomyces sp. NPDC001537]